MHALDVVQAIRLGLTRLPHGNAGLTQHDGIGLGQALVQTVHQISGLQRIIRLGGDGVDQVVQFALRHLQCAATTVAEHAQQAHMELPDRVFEGCDDRVVDHLAGGAHGEQVAKALVEDDFRGYA